MTTPDHSGTPAPLRQELGGSGEADAVPGSDAPIVAAGPLRKTETVASAAPDMTAFAEGLEGSRSLVRQRRRLKQAGLVLGLAAVLGGMGFLVRAPVAWLLSDMKATFSAAFWPRRIQLSAPVICTGLNSEGVPEGVGQSFSEEEVRGAGLAVFLTYSGAVPKKTRFQMRWSSDSGVLESKAQTLEREADSILLKLGHDVPPGEHKIQFLIDGAVRDSASLVVHAAGREGQARARVRPKSRLASSAPAPHAPVPEAPPADVRPLPSTPAARPPTAAESGSQRPAAMVFRAGHKHALGSCQGDLRLTPQSVGFTSEQHTVEFGVNEVNVDDDGIQEPSGRWWRFFGAEADLGKMLHSWKRGELFRKAAEQESHAAQAADPAGIARSYRAAHKHRLGSCSGEFRLTPAAIEFHSPEHSFAYEVGQVQIEGSGIRDAAGRTWRFDIPGEDVGEILRAWRGGVLSRK